MVELSRETLLERRGIMAKRNFKCNFNVDYTDDGNMISHNMSTPLRVVLRYVVVILVLLLAVAIIVLLIIYNIKTLPLAFK